MSKTPGDLQQQAEEFGQETAELLSATLPGLPDPPVRILGHENRIIIRPPGSKSLPLYAKGQHLADMKISIACQMDSVGKYLAVEQSTFNLVAVLDRAPVLRIHFRRESNVRPAAHVCTDVQRDDGGVVGGDDVGIWKGPAGCVPAGPWCSWWRFGGQSAVTSVAAARALVSSTMALRLA